MPKSAVAAAPWQQEERKIYLRDIFFLFLIVILSILVSEQWLLVEDASPVDRIFTYLLLFIPVGTLNLIAHYYYRNRRIRQTGNLRSSLRYRLSLAFMLIAVIPSIPIFLISANNVEVVTESLFNVEVADAMDSANATISYYEREIAGRFYEDLVRASPALARTSLDPRRDIERVFARQILIPGRDFAGVFAKGEFRFASTDIFEEQKLPIFLEQTEEFGYKAPFAAATLRGSDYIFYRFPAKLSGKGEHAPGDGFVILGRKLHPGLEDHMRNYQRVYASFRDEGFWKQEVPGTLRLGLALLYIFMVCSALVISLIIARQISLPIVSLAAATRAVTDGDLDTRLDLRASGELGVLIESFNQMTQELRSLRERLLHSQRLAAWQEVARRLAHEIKNPLTPIQLSADRMIRRLDHPEKGHLHEVVRSGCRTIIQQVEVLKELVHEFANFARLPKARMQAGSLDAIVSEAVNGFQAVVPGIPIEMHLAGNLPEIPLDKTIIIGMTNNLVKNGVEAIAAQPEKRRRHPPRVVLSTALVRQGIRKFVRLRVEDTGPGIDEGLEDRVFEPYFTTKGRAGSGLGLSLVERAALEHDARLQVGRSPLGGAEFTILFRIQEAPRRQRIL
ncbi:MAG: HAMP domain-containing protein [Leptospirales bacterium]|jgi:two-component system nitrogen regulation sensor histidine kinase NtrY